MQREHGQRRRTLGFIRADAAIVVAIWLAAKARGAIPRLQPPCAPALTVAVAWLPRRSRSRSTGATAAAPVPLAEIPRRFLALPQDAYLGPGFDLVAVSVFQGGGRALSFMLDSGLTSSMLRPPVAKDLDLKGDASAGERSFIGADGSRVSAVVRLEDAQLEGVDVKVGPLSPMVLDFPQAEIGRELGHVVDGMLGMEFYERFAVEVDCVASCLRLYAADAGEAAAQARGMEQLTTAMLPSRLLGVAVELAEGADLRMFRAAPSRRVVGIVDTGASHSVLNWAAAATLLGVRSRDDARLASAGRISSMDVSGRLVDMPLLSIRLRLKGAGPQARGAADFEAIEIAIGDIALFARLLGGNTSEPAALIGQDILVQRPMLLAARERLLCFSP